MADWFQVARERLPIGVTLVEDLTPAPAGSRYTPGGRVIHLRCCQSYRTKCQCDTCDGRWFSLEVADHQSVDHRDRLVVTLTREVEARVRGYGEFDPERVPSLRSITDPEDLSRGQALLKSVEHKDPQLPQPRTRTSPVTDRRRSVLLILVEVRVGLGTAYLEFTWRDGQLALTATVLPSRDTLNTDYTLTEAGYFDGYVDRNATNNHVVVELNGWEVIRHPTSGAYVMFEQHLGRFGVVATTHDDALVILPDDDVESSPSPSRSAPSPSRHQVHLRSLPRPVTGALTDHYQVKLTDEESTVRVEDLLTERVDQWRNWASLVVRYRLIPAIYYDTEHRRVIYVEPRAVIIYGRRVLTRVRLDGDLSIVDTQWLPWRSTLVLFAEVQHPRPDQAPGSRPVVIPLRLEYTDQSAPRRVDVPLTGLTASLWITMMTRE